MMETQFLANTDAAAAISKHLAACDQFAFAVAWAGKNRIADALLKHTKKAKRGVIGTHMYQTSPVVLRNFVGSAVVRYMPPNGKLFHPKIYAFWRGNSMTALVGSHNLTESAFSGRNIEASLMCTGKASDPALRDIAHFIERVWSDAHRIEDDSFLFAYSRLYELNKSKCVALETFHPVKRPPRGVTPTLTLTWSEFVEGVRNDPHSTEEERIAILQRARELFLEYGSLARMPRDNRREIAGTYGRVELAASGFDWGCFGTMSAHGDFKNLINDDPGDLSAALDHVPLNGEVTESQYSQFAARFRDAFEGKSHRGGVPTASRLLAMKRPDWFVTVNHANRDGLCAALAVAPTTLTMEKYWSSIVVPITLSSWWNHPRPASKSQGRIWDCYAALLDSLYYEPIKEG